MKKIWVLLFALVQTLMAAELKHITIGNQDFSITTETYDIYDSKGEVLRLYREERNNNLTFVFSLILKDRTGPCSEKSVEDGYYEINGTTVTLYSHWDRRGKAYDAPYGARIQVYELKDNYDLVRTSSSSTNSTMYVSNAEQVVVSNNVIGSLSEHQQRSLFIDIVSEFNNSGNVLLLGSVDIMVNNADVTRNIAWG